MADPTTSVPNSKSAAKKEAKRLEEAKLAAKRAKAPATPTADKKAKADKKKDDEEPPFVNTTPKGTKKVPDLSRPMPAGYSPAAVESAWYDWWLQQGFFKPQLTPDGKPKPEGLFVIPAPPPNVTGSLHIGHALTTAIQDGFIRWNRMLGKTTLFVPGFDHASISTQSVVEKRLYKAEGKTRHDLGREKFLNVVMDWTNEITNQLRRLDGSYEWSRLSKAVIETFCRLHEDGVLYRANRLVNWCKQLNGRTLLNLPGYDVKERFELGVITSFAYPIDGSDEKIDIATTCPETMLGDTAIAVHPDDPRYTHLHGKFAKHPFLDRCLPIITDSIAVDMEFGTGAVKITPAHDPNDYEVGVRHNLDFVNILNDDGTLNANTSDIFKGMKRFHARVEVVNKLKELGLFVEIKDNPMQIPIYSKSGDPQWWVNCKPLAEEAIKGHCCPAYFVRIEGKEQDSNDGKNWVVGRTLEEATERTKVLAAGAPFVLEQNEDVLDTWFSSGLWPFSILGWPENSLDLQTFYPSSVLETGWDILFFWLTGQVPFSEVLCHAMIRDAQDARWQSLGNVIDPIDVIQGLSLEELHQKLYEGNLDEKKIIKAKTGQKKDFPKCIRRYRKFCNKIFNATKFAMFKLDETFVPEPVAEPTGNESLVEQWIFHRLISPLPDQLALAERNFMDTANAVHNFGSMTEESSPDAVKKSAQQRLYTYLDYGLRLLHPFMPFVTNELWQRWLDVDFEFKDADKKFDLVFTVLKAGRSLAASYNLQSGIQFFIQVQADDDAVLFLTQLPTIVTLTKGCKSAIVVRDNSEMPAGCGSGVVTSSIVVHTLVRGLVDLDVEIGKCDKKPDLARLNLSKVAKVESQPDYETTVQVMCVKLMRISGKLWKLKLLLWNFRS
ncbi:tRNA synthetases class I-domain-containing protein [Cyathus striatus]|nr:tRNA synthetases class I-domain-containing protein [Cyathus striatus]